MMQKAPIISKAFLEYLRTEPQVWKTWNLQREKTQCTPEVTQLTRLSEVTLESDRPVDLVALLTQEAKLQYSIMMQGKILSALKTQGIAKRKQKITGALSILKNK